MKRNAPAHHRGVLRYPLILATATRLNSDVAALGQRLWQKIIEAAPRQKQLLLRSLLQSITAVKQNQKITGHIILFVLPGVNEQIVLSLDN